MLLRSALLLFFSITYLNAQDILRFSEVVDKDGEGVEKMIYTGEFEGEVYKEELWIKKEAIATEADVERAVPSFGQGGEAIVDITLTKAGGEKMANATSKMRRGVTRMAMILDGEIISAPRVNAIPLGRRFLIEGQENFEEAAILASKIRGKNKNNNEGENKEVREFPPRPETVPYTNEEYEQIKATREKRGIYYIDKFPGADELDKLLKKGMSLKDVEKTFGTPCNKEGSQDSLHYYYELAPEKYPVELTDEMAPIGFTVVIKKGKVTEWGVTRHTSETQRKKRVNQPPSFLNIEMPHQQVMVELLRDRQGLEAYAEKIKIPDPSQKLTSTDLWALLYIVDMVKQSWVNLTQEQDIDNERAISSDCDFIKTLAHNFDEVAEMRKSSKNGKISSDELYEKLMPYLLEGKQLPVEDPEEK